MSISHSYYESLAYFPLNVYRFRLAYPSMPFEHILAGDQDRVFKSASCFNLILTRKILVPIGSRIRRMVQSRIIRSLFR